LIENPSLIESSLNVHDEEAIVFVDVRVNVTNNAVVELLFKRLDCFLKVHKFLISWHGLLLHDSDSLITCLSLGDVGFVSDFFGYLQILRRVRPR